MSFQLKTIEFALILRDSAYKADSDLNALITRLSDLNLADDEFKTEFKDVVVKYRNIIENTKPS